MDLLILKYAAPYIKYYKGKTFVVKLGGAMLGDTSVLHRICEQIVLLTHLGIKVIVVHGGGPQATDLLKRLGVESSFVAGRRVTDEHGIEVARMVFRGTLNLKLVEALQNIGALAVGLSGADGSMVLATKRPPVMVRRSADDPEELVDYGFVGDIEEVQPRLLLYLIDGGFVPVVCSLAHDENYQVLNVNADMLAANIAVAVKAEKLIMITEVPGILEDVGKPETLIPYMDREGVGECLREGIISGGMMPKVDAALFALEHDVDRVHIVSGYQEDSILREIFTNAGSGTLLVFDETESPAVPIEVPGYLKDDGGESR